MIDTRDPFVREQLVHEMAAAIVALNRGCDEAAACLCEVVLRKLRGATEAEIHALEREGLAILSHISRPN